MIDLGGEKRYNLVILKPLTFSLAMDEKKESGVGSLCRKDWTNTALDYKICLGSVYFL
jgi:hypothetical protein